MIRGDARRMWALWGTVFASVAVAAAAGAATPLLSLYRTEWGFPLWELTAAFAVYAATLLFTLLTAGSLSDHVGRRPVLGGALSLMIVASALFLIDDGIGWVLVGRALQGVATGAATSTFAASIVELTRPRRRAVMTVVTSAAPVGGLALGACVTGVSVDAIGDATRIVFGVLVVSFVVGGVAVASGQETAARTAGALASLRPRIAVPPAARSTFFAVAPLIAAGWMFSGLFLGLGPAIDRTVFGVEGAAINGVIVALQPAAAAIAGIPFARMRSRTAAGIGSLLMVAGGVTAVAGVVAADLFVLATGAVVGGIGQGAGFGSALRLLGSQADNSDRGGLFSAAYLVAYASYGLPVLVAGLLAEVWALSGVVAGYGVVVTALGAWAGVLIIRRAERHDAVKDAPSNAA